MMSPVRPHTQLFEFPLTRSLLEGSASPILKFELLPVGPDVLTLAMSPAGSRRDI
jgi:hypothetical protein